MHVGLCQWDCTPTKGPDHTQVKQMQVLGHEPHIALPIHQTTSTVSYQWGGLNPRGIAWIRIKVPHLPSATFRSTGGCGSRGSGCRTAGHTAKHEVQGMRTSSGRARSAHVANGAGFSDSQTSAPRNGEGSWKQVSSSLEDAPKMPLSLSLLPPTSLLTCLHITRTRLGRLSCC